MQPALHLVSITHSLRTVMVPSSFAPMLVWITLAKEMLITGIKFVILLLGGIIRKDVLASSDTDSIENVWKKYRELPLQGSNHQELSYMNGTEEVLIDNNEDDTKSTTVEEGLGISGETSKVTIAKEKNKTPINIVLFRQAFS